MPQPRVPTNILKMRGADKNHPERIKKRENEPRNINPVGAPSEHLSDIEKEFFKEIVDLSIEGVLGEADRISVEQAACLLVKCRGLGEDPVTAAEKGLFFKYLGQLGMLPADRSKISIPGKKKKNAFDD